MIFDGAVFNPNKIDVFDIVDMNNKLSTAINMIAKLSNFVCELSGKVDILLKTTSLKNFRPKNPESVAKPSHQSKNPELIVKSNSFNFKRIKTIDDAKQMDQLLKNVEYEEHLSKQLIREFGTDIGIGSGKRHVAFDLKARMFENSFFTHFSWSGQSHKERVELTAFRSYGTLINFFWKIVNNADQSFNVNDNKRFFQGVMNRKHQCSDNAEDSAAPARKRIKSHGKIRPKIGSYKKKQRTEIHDGPPMIPSLFKPANQNYCDGRKRGQTNG